MGATKHSPLYQVRARGGQLGPCRMILDTNVMDTLPGPRKINFNAIYTQSHHFGINKRMWNTPVLITHYSHKHTHTHANIHERRRHHITAPTARRVLRIKSNTLEKETHALSYTEARHDMRVEQVSGTHQR